MIESKKKPLCTYIPGESYKKCLNIKEQQIIKNSHHNKWKWKAQFCKEIHFLQSDLLFQCNMNQRLKHIFSVEVSIVIQILNERRASQKQLRHP